LLFGEGGGVLHTYNVIFLLYGGIHAVNGIRADTKAEAVFLAKQKCGVLPVHLKECIQTDVERSEVENGL